jgi:ligand-binding sensor domain-containing protein
VLVLKGQVERRHDVIVQVGGDAARIVPVFPEAEEAVGVEGALSRRAEPLLPVDVSLAGGIRTGARINAPVPISVRIVPAVGALHRYNLAERAGLHDIADFVPPRPGERLHTDLHHSFRLAHLRGNLRRFIESMGHRLFAVHITSAIERRQCDRGVPVVGSSDEYRVDVLAVEQFLMMRVLLRIGRLLCRARQPRLIDVTERDDSNVAFFASAMERHVEEPGASGAEPDDGSVDAVVRSENAAVGGERGGNSRYAVDEIPSCDANLHGRIVSEIPHILEPMRHKRTWLALGVVLAAAGLYSALALWRAARALRTSAEQIEREARIPFTADALDPQVPAGFETLAAPAGFRDATIFGGRIFIGGGSGLFEYDGNGVLVNRFRTGIELPAAPVTALATGAGGGSAMPELWIATAGEGALAYDGAHFRHIRPDAAAFRDIRSILPLATGRVLFGTDKSGVLAFDGTQLSTLHPSLAGVHVTALAGEEASLWIGTRDSGVLHWHAGELDHFGEEEGLPDAHVFSITVAGDTAYAATVLGIAEIRERRVQRVLAQGFAVQSVVQEGAELLAGTLDEGLVRVLLDAKTRPVANESAECANCTIQRVLHTPDAVLALTSDGLYRIGARRTEWTPVLKAEDARLADRNISALAPDSNGRLWVGYFDRGLDIFDPAGGPARHVEDDVVFCVNRIVHDRERERVGVATSNGLVLFTGSGDKRQVLTRADGLIASHVTDVLFRPDGTIVAGTPAGVSFIEASRISSIYAFQGLVNNHVYTLAAMGSRTFAGTLGGLSVIETGLTTASFTTANSGFKHNWITAVLPVSNDIFAGTYGGGIMHLGSGGTWTGFDDLPPSFEVNPNAMAASDRAVYAGTLDRGLALYERSTGRWRWITRGLPSVNVTAISAQAGLVYIGTDNGLVRVPEDTLLK